jgi:DNA-binding transcriptional ArsR family regulator
MQEVEQPRVIPVGQEPPPLRPARATHSLSGQADPSGQGDHTDQSGQASQGDRRSRRRRGHAVRRRFQLLNAFVDLALPLLGPVDVAVWLVVYRHGQRDGTATAAVSDLARRTGYRQAAVRLALRRLRDCGMIERVKRGTLAGGPSVYRLIMPADGRP